MVRKQKPLAIIVTSLSLMAISLFPLAVILIPIYIMEYNLGILNSYIGLIPPNLLLILPFAIFTMHGTFVDLSRELEDSAEIGGCNAPSCTECAYHCSCNCNHLVHYFAYYHFCDLTKKSCRRNGSECH